MSSPSPNKDALIEASERLRIRDCEHAGIDPALNMTATLYRMLYPGRQPRRKDRDHDRGNHPLDADTTRRQ